jgi:hypothetical protein
VLKLNPLDLQFYQLIAMRNACEFEAWDRLAFSTAYSAAFAGVKKIRFEDYHKFLADAPKKSITKDELHALKTHF